jgi:hypothetical protein
MRLIAVTAVALLTLAAPALGEVRTLAEVHTSDRGVFPVVDAVAGRVVWSDYDAAAGAWRLMEHRGGVTRALPVAPRATPFDVDLGPDGSGGTVAVYSRCTRRLPFDRSTPQQQRTARRYGCDIYAFSFATGVERAVRSVNSRADEYWPTVWGRKLAFVRAYGGRREPDRTTAPYLYLQNLAGTVGSRRLRRPSPVVVIRHRGPEGRSIERRRLSTMIEAPDLRGRTVAYAWRRIDDDVTTNFIYLATVGGGLRPAAPGATSGGGAAVHVRSVDAPVLDSRRVNWLFVNNGEPEDFGAFGQRSRGGGAVLASARTKAVAFGYGAGIAYWIDGERSTLMADDAVTYQRMPRSWQPIRPPR